MLDKDLAELYGVRTKALNLAVRRNASRFPADFMFQLNKGEVETLRFQIETSKTGRGGRRYLAYVFTEQGVAMLSSVLHSEQAIQVNIQIMRTFSKIRQMIDTHKDLRRKIEEMERNYDRKFKTIFDALRELLQAPAPPKRKIGFH